MKQSLTPETLIRFAYEDTDLDTSSTAFHAITHDPEARSWHRDIRRIQQCLDRFRMKPSPAVVTRILEFSRSDN